MDGLFKNVENLAGFTGQNSIYYKVFFYVHKNMFMPQTSDLLEMLALIFLYNFHREHKLLKIKIKNYAEN